MNLLLLLTEKFGYPAFAPYSGGSVDLLTGEIISEGIRMPKKASEKPAENPETYRI